MVKAREQNKTFIYTDTFNIDNPVHDLFSLQIFISILYIYKSVHVTLQILMISFQIFISVSRT